MATYFSGSQTQDSDEVKEMYCEECDRHGDGYATAVAFCVDCEDYICVTCQRYHKRQFKTHKIQDSNSMPQDFYFEKCSTHPGQLVKFYCSECKTEACQECKDNGHVNCRDIAHLPTLASDIQKSDELINFSKNMDQLSKDIQDTEKLLDAKSEVIKKQEENVTESCTEHSNKLITTYKQHHQDLIDDFDNKMEETIARLEKERLELIQKLSVKETKFEENIRQAETDMKEEVVETNTNFKKLKFEHLNLVGNLKALTVDLEQAHKVGKNCELFIKLKLVKQMCKQIQVTTDQIQHSNIQRYKLKKSDIQPTVKSLENQTSFFSFDEVHVSAVERRLTFDLNINHEFKRIISLLVLSEHTLLALNYDRCTLVIFILEKSNAKCIKETKFKNLPCGITKVSDHKVAVTFPYERMIRLITFSEEMEVLNTTEIPGHGCCFGIAYSNNHLVVSHNESFTENINILSMSGEIVKSFDTDDNGQTLFNNPWYLTVSPDNSMIYVSDCDRHTVTCLTFDGTVKAIYKDDQLKCPLQLAVDEYGSVYVCGRDSNNVHQLSHDLTKVKILLDKNHGMYTPASIAYCQNTKRLLVGMNQSSKIKIFNVSLE
ncbi:uncharacterized protein LOC132743771 [Ruditapes philippinarum]|uniref:uncharacterized protein LOC132743771 n=1 Tax=Ruditapes philippinarum TaxID=129788 RepID=UPI00295B7EFA|nr:uncharacterized protein LOC132743771 [Ruditapes philippinarum]